MKIPICLICHGYSKNSISNCVKCCDKHRTFKITSCDAPNVNTMSKSNFFMHNNWSDKKGLNESDYFKNRNRSNTFTVYSNNRRNGVKINHSKIRSKVCDYEMLIQPGELKKYGKFNPGC